MSGCGDFGVLTALYQACAQLQIPPHELMVVSGIGCSSNLPGFIRSYGAHTLHGRLLPFATGCKLANQNMTVIAQAVTVTGMASVSTTSSRGCVGTSM